MDIVNRITTPIRQFEDSSGLSHSKVYDLIQRGEIDSLVIGKRRYILVQSYLDYLERQVQLQKTEAKRASPNPRAKGGGEANSPAALRRGPGRPRKLSGSEPATPTPPVAAQSVDQP